MMAGAPRFKVYTPDGRYVAACKEPADAAAIVALYGDGTTLRDGHKTIVWTEGEENMPANVSYDNVATVVWERC